MMFNSLIASFSLFLCSFSELKKKDAHISKLELNSENLTPELNAHEKVVCNSLIWISDGSL